MCVGFCITTNYVSFYELPFNIYFPMFGFLTLLSLSFLYHYFILYFIWSVWWVFFCSLISNYVGFFFFLQISLFWIWKRKKKIKLCLWTQFKIIYSNQIVNWKLRKRHFFPEAVFAVNKFVRLLFLRDLEGGAQHEQFANSSYFLNFFCFKRVY